MSLSNLEKVTSWAFLGSGIRKTFLPISEQIAFPSSELTVSFIERSI